MPYSYPGCKKPAIFAKCRLSTQCIQKLPIKEMSHILRERGMNYLQFLERSEFIKAVVQSQPGSFLYICLDTFVDFLLKHMRIFVVKMNQYFTSGSHGLEP